MSVPVIIESISTLVCNITLDQLMQLSGGTDMYFSLINNSIAILDANNLKGYHQNAIADIFGEEFLTQITGHLVVFTVNP